MQKNQNLIQLSWHNINITANITVGKCLCCKPGVTTQKKIIDGVSGTVLPGQFLAIIGASGNLIHLFSAFIACLRVSLTKTYFRGW